MNLNTRNILFTGAGFSANFGGFLASDMWSLIFNHELVQEKEQVKEVMRRELEDFERAIEIIQSRAEYKDDEKKAIQIAVDYAYKLLDSKIIKEYDSEVSSGRLLDFIKLFKLNQKGFFFTLNQDLFVERFLLGVVRLRPGISQKKVSFRQKLPLKEWEICTVPTKEMIDRKEETFFIFAKGHAIETACAVIVQLQKDKYLLEKGYVWFAETDPDTIPPSYYCGVHSSTFLI